MPDAPDLDIGTPGASARREHERRRARRETAVRERHPRIGGLLLALQDEPQSETAWARGARGEEIVAAHLARYLRDDVVVLHDRRIPGSRANIDHIAVAASGVWVIDAKRYKGKVEIRRPFFGAATLRIKGRDQTKLITGLDKQVALVRSVLEPVAPEVQVRGALCFSDADLPAFGTLTFSGHPLVYPKALAKRINAKGPLDGDAVRHVAGVLAGALRVA